MAGGVGFSSMGHNSFRHNRKLRNRRPLLKENPYAASCSYAAVSSTNAGSPPSHEQPAQAYRSTHRRNNLFAFAFLTLLAFILLWLAS